MIRSDRSMLGVATMAAFGVAQSGTVLEAVPDLSAPPSAGPGKRPSGVRGSSGPRVLGPPETSDQLLAAMSADRKRERRLERNRRASGGAD